MPRRTVSVACLNCGAQFNKIESDARRSPNHLCSTGCRDKWIGKKQTVHGHCKRGARTGTHKSWAGMLQRCTNPKNPRYLDYGGRGITVCDRWRDSFDNFLADMGERPPGKTLDRYPDKDGNYEPGNCRWATDAEQRSNRSDNVVLEHDGRRMTVTEWADHLGVPPGRLHARVNYGFPVDVVLKAELLPRQRQQRLNDGAKAGIACRRGSDDAEAA